MVERGLKIKVRHHDAVRLDFSKMGLYIVMILLACFMALPLIYALGTAFMSSRDSNNLR